MQLMINLSKHQEHLGFDLPLSFIRLSCILSVFSDGISYIFPSVTDQVLTTQEQFLPSYLANLVIKQEFSINLHLIRSAVVFPVSVDMCFVVAGI